MRRRAYDALNVLEAIGMISKTKKAIRWQGWPQVGDPRGTHIHAHAPT